ncbi:sensor histidine kinase [Kitasatospora paracochleata]|uniref:histidine kinase n=1 Tax=Kitasatospora paracochleata TaxID=58354 RepID=A0ABT1IRU6_9ACTN|nr:ATP-binding protein [Kitasatospora paracochleata]MCP2307852.1 signal transduction histidine kinase [Kitasatospora paracochleata]
MRARTRPDRAVNNGRDSGTTLWSTAGVLAGLGAAVLAVASTAAAHRAAVAATAGVAAVLWCALVLLAAKLGGRALRAERELGTVQHDLTAVRAQAAALHTDLAATHNAAAALRAALASAQVEADRDRAELQAARVELTELQNETAALRGAAQNAAEERAELGRLQGEILPEVVTRLRAGASVDTALAPYRALGHARLLRTVAEEVGRGERQRAAALAVCATAAGRVQALATSMHAELRDMQHRHGEDVLGDLLSLDHSTAQVGRMADSIAVLTGARSGRRWTKPIPVESILRGALGRIGAYQRVRLHSASTAAVAGFAAEGVMHTLAELLDNAANFSAPPAEVHVYVEEVHSGLVITVEDGGLGLSESWLRKAEQAVSGKPLDLSTLSAGTRLGLAVVGSLARKHGLSISFRPSARGGTGVVVLIPEQLVTHPSPALARALVPEAPVERPAPAARPAIEPRRTEAERPAEPAGTENGLPQRRRGSTLPTTTLPAPAAQPVRPLSTASAARFGAFRKALQQGPTTTDALPEDDS